MSAIETNQTRIVAAVKISGERLAAIAKLGEDVETSHYSVNETALLHVANEIADARRAQPDHRFIIGVGGGNFYRGRNRSIITAQSAHWGGRLSTAINARFLGDALNHINVPPTLLLAPSMRLEDNYAEPGFIPYSPEALHEAHQDNHVVILAGGLGIPEDTSDAATIRAAAAYRAHSNADPNSPDVEVDVIKMTHYDGLFTSDPAVPITELGGHAPRQRYMKIGAQEVIDNYDRLSVVDPTSLQLMVQDQVGMLIAGHMWTLPELVRDRPDHLAQAGIGTLIVPHAVEATYHFNGHSSPR